MPNTSSAFRSRTASPAERLSSSAARLSPARRGLIVPRVVPAAGVALAMCSLVLPPALRAQERSHRFFGPDQGLNPPAVRSIAQDASGFLWIGTEAGLVRYDGVEMRRWSPETLDRTVIAIAASPGRSGRASGALAGAGAEDASVVALRDGGALFSVTPAAAVRLAGPDGRAIGGARDAAFDARGGLWFVRADTAWRRDPGTGAWRAHPIPLADDDYLRLVRRGAGNDVHLVGRWTAWRLSPGGAPANLPLPADLIVPIMDVHTTSDGRVLALSFLGHVLELSEDGFAEVMHTADLGAAGRAIALLERSGTIWIAVDRYLVGWRPGSPPTVLGPDAGIESGGPLLVDHEGSLWMGAFAGLYQFAEPEAALWTERSGLPTSHVRYVERAAGRIWVTTWQGAAWLRPDPDGWAMGRLTGWTANPPFVDSRGALWAGSDRGVLEVAPDGGVRSHLGAATALLDAHEEPGGPLWLATAVGLFVAPAPGAALRRVPVAELARDPPEIDAVLVDRSGMLWASGGETICRARAREVLEAALADWTCESIPGAVHVTGGGLVQMPSGALWLSTSRLGVLRRGAGGWEPVPGAADLTSRSILSLVPSPAGGVWVAGHGTLRRVEEAPEDPAGWRVVERLGAWHGLPGEGGTHVLEDPDGALWATTALGLVRVPAAARFHDLPPPPVQLVDARVDHERIPLGEALELPHDRNRLELRFAALSFRDPTLLSYQVRLSSEDPWVSTAGAPFFRWVDLPPGRYAAEVRASLDGRTWTASPARFAFRVAPPWYLRWWAIAALAAAVAALAYAAHRQRLDRMLELERQRTRIAMDLHDEIGSGLGSIGILSGLLSSDRADDAEKRRLAGEIALTTRDLSAALGQIVWTLHPRARTLEELAARLVELGRRLFTGTPTEFSAHLPERIPEVRLGPLTRRNVLLMGLEALHNAARHARASRVDLRLSQRGDAWELEVVDDGVGMAREGASAAGDGDGGPAGVVAGGVGLGAGGVGLDSMRRRADEIDGEVRIERAEGGGTRVRLTFRPRGRSVLRPATTAGRSPGRIA